MAKNRTLMFTDLQNKIIHAFYDQGMNRKEIKEMLGCSKSYLNSVIRTYDYENDVYEDDSINGELIVEASRLARDNQRLKDIQRVERKSARTTIRHINAIEEIAKEIIRVFDGRKPARTIKHEEIKAAPIGIFHISDTHFNELIEIPNNTYDFNVAAKRLKKMVIEAKTIFKALNVKKVLFAMTGDLLNSDRRLDEQLNKATNRAKATSLSALLLEQVIIDLNKDFNIMIAYAAGNESRAIQEFGYSDIMMSDNYDLMIVEMLKLMLRKTNGIKFIEQEYVDEVVIDVNGTNILMLHGHQIGSAKQSKKLQEIRGKYSDRGIRVDFMLYGHLHQAYISDLFARSSSICGSNAYSDGALQLSGKASQNIHIVRTDKSINSIKIDLQNTDGIKGYHIEKDLEAYNAKSAKKLEWRKPKKI